MYFDIREVIFRCRCVVIDIIIEYYNDIKWINFIIGGMSLWVRGNDKRWR